MPLKKAGSLAGIEVICAGFNDLATIVPEIAEQWHPTKNGDLTPEMVTAYSNKKVWWYLPYDDPKTGMHFDFEWKTKVAFRVNFDAGCPFLSGRAVWKRFNDLATIAPEIAEQWHPTKNRRLTPEMVTVNSGKKVWWKCSKCGHEWRAVIGSRAYGSGCPCCARTVNNDEYSRAAKPPVRKRGNRLSGRMETIVIPVRRSRLSGVA